jgi:histidinol-phosphate/aromatic aminotransferase/cobyric acid decarboxylase-like protein
MTPIPKPTLQQAVDALSDRDEYKVVLHFLRDERERLFGDLRQCSDSNDVMKVAGSIASHG